MRCDLGIGYPSVPELPAVGLSERQYQRCIEPDMEDDPQRVENLRKLVRKYFGEGVEKRMFPEKKEEG